MWPLALLYEMSDDDWDHVTLCMGCVVCDWYALTLGRLRRVTWGLYEKY